MSFTPIIATKVELELGSRSQTTGKHQVQRDHKGNDNEKCILFSLLTLEPEPVLSHSLLSVSHLSCTQVAVTGPLPPSSRRVFLLEPCTRTGHTFAGKASSHSFLWLFPRLHVSRVRSLIYPLPHADPLAGINSAFTLSREEPPPPDQPVRRPYALTQPKWISC